MVLARGDQIGTLYKLDALFVQCNSVSRKSRKVTHVEKETKVSIGENALEVKLPI